MTLDFDRMPSLVQPRFKGGQGEAETRIFQDGMGKILRLTLGPAPPSAFIPTPTAARSCIFCPVPACAWTTAWRRRFIPACATTAPRATATAL